MAHLIAIGINKRWLLADRSRSGKTGGADRPDRAIVGTAGKA